MQSGYFPAYSYDAYDQLDSAGIFPYLWNDAGVSDRVNARLSVDALAPGLLPIAMGLTAFSSCYQSELTLIVSGVGCSTNDPNGFGVFTFNWDSR